MPKIAVLLAGFNGSKYIIEQVFSILNQKYVFIDIYIRVDGCCEIFRGILKKLSYYNKNIILIEGDVISSSSQNFYNLICNINYSNYDFFALSDQDDIWQQDKLRNAINHLGSATPEAYSSGLTAFYPNGRITKQELGEQSEYDFYFQSGGAGCTYVFNRAGFMFLKMQLNDHPTLLKISAHDWLFYYLFRVNHLSWFFGGATDIMYRQHPSNVAGINRGLSGKVVRIKALFNGWYLKDLCVLLNFAHLMKTLPKFYNPFTLRRTYCQSVFIWLYYWLYVRSIINIK